MNRAVTLWLAITPLVLAAIFAGHIPRANAVKPLPPTSVSVQGGYIVVSTTAKTSRLDTYVYISPHPGTNFIYNMAVPASINNDPGWNCPCTAQIAQRARSGTLKILTDVSATFTPSP
jgi:hypothetical protein